jgi:hypothetical protein
MHWRRLVGEWLMRYTFGEYVYAIWKNIMQN